MLWRETADPQTEPFKVLLKRGEFVDSGRQRAVPFKIYYPADAPGGSSFPLIVWSHGFGGNQDGAGFLSRYLAAQGYVLLHITHAGTDSSLWEGKPGHPWDILRSTSVSREITINRFLDVPFAVDALKGWARDNPDVGMTIDFSSLGMSGHSFGALTTQVMAGQLFPDAHGHLIDMKQPRFAAGILYSPVPVEHMTAEPHEKIYGPIDMPIMHMTGTNDESPLEGFGYKHRLLVHDYMRHPEKYLLIKQGGDHMVYNGTRGKLEANPLRERHEDIIRVGALAFWDTYLKNDDAAKAWLAGEGFKAYLGEDALFMPPRNLS